MSSSFGVTYDEGHFTIFKNVQMEKNKMEIRALCYSFFMIVKTKEYALSFLFLYLYGQPITINPIRYGNLLSCPSFR